MDVSPRQLLAVNTISCFAVVEMTEACLAQQHSLGCQEEGKMSQRLQTSVWSLSQEAVSCDMEQEGTIAAASSIDD